MTRGHKTKYLHVPFGLLFLTQFAYLVSRPYRRRHPNSKFHGEPLAWTEMFVMYVASVAALFTALFLYENIRAVLYPKPRRLSLTEDYVNAQPKKVDKLKAFEYDTPVTLYEQVKFYFFVFSGIAFLRFFTLILCVAAGMIAVAVGGKGGRREHPYWFAFWANVAVFSAHLGLAAVGIYHVPVYGKFAHRSEAKILIGNHSCVIEVLLMFMLGDFPSFVSRKENTKVLFFSSVCEVSDAILVDRDAATSRKQTLDAILARTRDPEALPLMVFPEGTTGNQKTLFLFKKGAFEAGKPVQMVCIAFPYKYFNPAWTGRLVGGNNMSDILIRLCSQFVNYAEIRVLPVYTPTEAEQKDSILYAGHCQRMMAAVLQENVSDATFKDYKQAEEYYAKQVAKTSQASLEED